jgi:CheY-like chemotaxis protein
MVMSACPGPVIPASSPTKISGRVLLAEDGEDNQRLLMAFLKLGGAEATLAVDGAEAVRLVKEANYNYDLILMDMQMPVMDGYQATAELRRAGYAKPIIAVTAHAAPEDRAKCLAAGCTDYLSKPISRSVLLSTCAGYLSSAPTPAAKPASGEAPAAPLPGKGSASLCSSLATDPRVAKVLDRFVSRLPERVSQIQTLLDGGDLENLRKAVHNLKGAGSGYGFAPLSEQSARAEDALRAQQSLDQIRREVDTLLQLIRRVSGYDAGAERGGSGAAPLAAAG